MKLRKEGVECWFRRRFEEIERTGVGQGETMVVILLIFNAVVPFFQHALHVMKAGDTLHVLIITDVHVGLNQKE